jgi:hypothetical protein
MSPYKAPPNRRDVETSSTLVCTMHVLALSEADDTTDYQRNRQANRALGGKASLLGVIEELRIVWCS